MRLIERYRRLGLWGKISFWGSVASIAGLAVGLWTLSPSMPRTASTVGNSSPAITVMGPRANVSVTYSDGISANGRGVGERVDDLVLSIATLVACGDGGRSYSDVIFVNRGRRDAALVQKFLLVRPKAAPVPEKEPEVLGVNLWDTHFSDKPIALPAQQMVTIRFQFRNDFLAKMREDYEMPQDFELTLFCSVIDADGNNHNSDRHVGTLRLTPTHWSAVRSGEEAESVCLLPSKISGHAMDGVGKIQVNSALHNPRDLGEGRITVPLNDIIKDIENHAKQ